MMRYLLCFLLLAPLGLAQRSTYDIAIKYRLDASGATKTLPMRAGTGSPEGRDACAAVGEMYYQTDATAGSNVWGCTATGDAAGATWTVQSGGGGGGSPVRRTITGGFSGSGSALTAGTTFPQYAVCTTMAASGTIKAYTIQVDTGSATFKLWKNSSSSAVPTVSDSISTSGWTLSGATKVHSTTLTDLSTTSFSAGDNLCIQLSAASDATDAKLILEYE